MNWHSCLSGEQFVNNDLHNEEMFSFNFMHVDMHYRYNVWSSMFSQPLNKIILLFLWWKSRKKVHYASPWDSNVQNYTRVLEEESCCRNTCRALGKSTTLHHTPPCISLSLREKTCSRCNLGLDVTVHTVTQSLISAGARELVNPRCHPSE